MVTCCVPAIARSSLRLHHRPAFVASSSIIMSSLIWQTPSERRQQAAAETKRVLQPYILVVLIPLVNEYGGACCCDPIAILWGRSSRGELRCYTCNRYYCWSCMYTCSGAIIPSRKSAAITAMRHYRAHPTSASEPPAEDLADRDAATCTRKCCPDCIEIWQPWSTAVLCCVRKAGAGATHDTGISDTV